MKKLGSCTVLGMILIAAVIITGMEEKRFFNGQVLMPDEVHQDTLIVTDAKYLEENIDSAMSDGGIIELLNETTVPYRK